MRVRRAVEDDAAEACLVLRRSIEELCIADHRGDANVLRTWLGNKTPENVLTWMRTPDQSMVVAEGNGRILGVGLATAGGDIKLNYVHPDARFQGVSRAILRALEDFLREHGNAVGRLHSTGTAHRFYLAAGYEDAGPPDMQGPVPGQPMEKKL
jgi:GNAT superfamily N-acetyltransferase